MKITYGMIVVDGMPFIKHQLKLIYDYAHEIIICEGGDNTWNKINGYRKSTDGTIEFIKSFSDPLNKIKLIQKNWNNKNEMCHEYSKKATGDIIWHIDIDEFVDPKHIPFIKKQFNNKRNQILSIPNFIIWGDTDTIVEIKNKNSWITNWFSFERIFRRCPGKYIHHIPERGYYDPKSNRVLPAPTVGPQIFKSAGIFTYHFSYVLPQSVKTKLKYYNNRIPGCIKKDWYENIFSKFKENKNEWIKNDFNVQPLSDNSAGYCKQRLRPLDHKLPEFLAELEKELMQ